MNILLERLPEAVEIDGTEYPINTDFRAGLAVILAFEDPELTEHEKQAVLLENLYPEPPHDLTGAILQGVKFLNGGESEANGDGADGPRLYSFAHDAKLIFAAFRQTHGIDLETAELHWWKFLALFMDLGQDTTFCNLVSLRKRIKTGKASKEELSAYREMRSLVDLPEPLSPAEQAAEDEFMRRLAAAQARRGGES